MAKDLKMLKQGVKEIRVAFSNTLYSKEGEYYRSLGPKYGLLAYEIFKTLDPALPWAYVHSRAKSIGFTPDDLEFWNDEQAVLVLFETLEKAGFYAEKICA